MDGAGFPRRGGAEEKEGPVVLIRSFRGSDEKNWSLGRASKRNIPYFLPEEWEDYEKKEKS